MLWRHLPGRSKAGSSRSGLFVAPMTNTSVDFEMPSSSARSCETTLHISTLTISWAIECMSVSCLIYVHVLVHEQYVNDLLSTFHCQSIYRGYKILTHTLTYRQRCLSITHLSMTPPESPLLPRFGARESSSSKKMTQGEALRAFSKTVGVDVKRRVKIFYRYCTI